MIKVYKKFLLMIAITIAIFIVVFNYPSYAFFSDTKLIDCKSVKKNTRLFKYEKKLLSQPTLTLREKGVWNSYCSDGKLKFNDDSIMCESKWHNSILDFVAKTYSYVNVPETIRDGTMKDTGFRYRETFKCEINSK